MNTGEKFRAAGAALAASSPANATLIKLAAEAMELEATIEQIEALLKERKGRYHELKTQELPDAMAALGGSAWTSEDKTITIKMEDYLSGTVPKEEPERSIALGWVESNGGEPLIKTEIGLSFEKKEHNIALDLAERLRSEGLEPSVKSGIHHQTLLAFLREKMRKGEPIDFETIGFFAGRIAKVTIKPAK